MTKTPCGSSLSPRIRRYGCLFRIRASKYCGMLVPTCEEIKKYLENIIFLIWVISCSLEQCRSTTQICVWFTDLWMYLVDFENLFILAQLIKLGRLQNFWSWVLAAVELTTLDYVAEETPSNLPVVVSVTRHASSPIGLANWAQL